jgi:hypothetical protein
VSSGPPIIGDFLSGCIDSSAQRKVGIPAEKSIHSATPVNDIALSVDSIYGKTADTPKPILASFVDAYPAPNKGSEKIYRFIKAYNENFIPNI